MPAVAALTAARALAISGPSVDSAWARASITSRASSLAFVLQASGLEVWARWQGVSAVSSAYCSTLDQALCGVMLVQRIPDGKIADAARDEPEAGQRARVTSMTASGQPSRTLVSVACSAGSTARAQRVLIAIQSVA